MPGPTRSGGRQPRVHLRVQSTRPSGVPGDRSGRETGSAAGPDQRRAQDLLLLFEQAFPPRHFETPGKSSGCPSGTVGTIFIFMMPRPERSRIRSPRATGLSASVDRVDEAARQIWFQAGGMRPGEDPYLLHCYRINFDGTGLTPLTEGERNACGLVFVRPEILRGHLVARGPRPHVSSCGGPQTKRSLSEVENAISGTAQGGLARSGSASSPKAGTERPTSMESSSGRLNIQGREKISGY